MSGKGGKDSGSIGGEMQGFLWTRPIVRTSGRVRLPGGEEGAAQNGWESTACHLAQGRGTFILVRSEPSSSDEAELLDFELRDMYSGARELMCTAELPEVRTATAICAQERMGAVRDPLCFVRRLEGGTLEDCQLVSTYSAAQIGSVHSLREAARCRHGDLFETP